MCCKHFGIPKKCTVYNNKNFGTLSNIAHFWDSKMFTTIRECVVNILGSQKCALFTKIRIYVH